MRVLLLGGTTEARLLAGELVAAHDVTVSLAGRVRSPLPLPGPSGSAGSVASTAWSRGCGRTAPTRSWTPRTRSRRR